MAMGRQASWDIVRICARQLTNAAFFATERGDIQAQLRFWMTLYNTIPLTPTHIMNSAFAFLHKEDSARQNFTHHKPWLLIRTIQNTETA